MLVADGGLLDDDGGRERLAGNAELIVESLLRNGKGSTVMCVLFRYFSCIRVLSYARGKVSSAALNLPEQMQSLNCDRCCKTGLKP